MLSEELLTSLGPLSTLNQQQMASKTMITRLKEVKLSLERDKEMIKMMMRKN